MIHRLNPDWGSHIPVLIRAFLQTEGDVLELGMGINSTPLLHAMSADRNRYLLSLDNDPIFIEGFKKYKTSNHGIQLIKNWNEVVPNFWGLVFVDNKPEASRKELIKTFANWAKLIVIHDSEPDKNDLYHYDEIYPLFKYRHDYVKEKVQTTVLSNFHEFN